MLEKLKSFLNKADTDFSKGYVDPFEYHKTFYKIMAAFQVADIESKHPPSYFNQNAILFVIATLAVLQSFITLCHGLETFDLYLITEAGSYFIILCYELLILRCTRRNLTEYHNFLRTMKKDFQYICTVGEKYRVPYFKNQLETWKVCIFTCIFTASLVIFLVIFAFLYLFYFLITTKPGDDEARPLLFPFWMPNVDFGKSPTYEIALIFFNTCTLLYSYNYTFMIQTQIVWIRQITSKVDVIIWSIQDLLVDVYPAVTEEESIYFDHLIETRMKEIVIHHQSMYSLINDYATVYKKLLMYEQTFCGPVICLTAYCLVEKFQVILLLICLAAIVLYFIPSYLCTYLGIKVRSICDACWNIPFWNAGPVIRPYMVLIMQRSLRPLPLQAPGFQEISIETFSKKMTSAYSCFNMLRQTDL